MTELTMTYTKFADKFGTMLVQEQSTWSELCAALTKPDEHASKADCPLIKLGTFGDQRTARGKSLRSDSNMTMVYGLEADYDAGLMTPETAAAKLAAADMACLIYTSPSHTDEKPRWRVLAPLSQGYPPTERRRLVALINGVLGGVLAPESFTCSQAFYFGKVRGVTYRAIQVQGHPVDELDLVLPEVYPTAAPAKPTHTSGTSGPDDLERLTLLHGVTPDTLADLRSALGVNPATGKPWIDPDDRVTWVAVAHALKCLDDDGLALWTEWSQLSPKYNDGADDPQAVWDSCSGDRADYRTVFAKAQAAGWLNPRKGQVPGVASSTDEPQEVSVSDLEHFAPDPPQFWAEEILPADVVTLLGAHGGTGKTTLALYAAVCFAMGLPFLGKQTRAAKVLFYSAEDDGALLRWRLATVCRKLGVDPAQLAPMLHVVDASEADSVLFVEASSGGVRFGQPTAAFKKLTERMAAHGSQIVILDNASDVYGADENNRGQVRTFIRLLAKLVKPVNGAVLLLAHVDKLTARTGGTQGYSGSTAWHNSVRSRLFMSEEAAGGLLLEHQKSNRGKRSEPMHLVWADGLPMLAASSSQPGGAGQGLEDSPVLAAVLALLDEFYQRGEFVSTSQSARNNAMKLLSAERGFPRGIKATEFWALLRDAERQHLIYREVYRTAQRKDAERWRVAAPSAPTCAHV